GTYLAAEASILLDKNDLDERTADTLVANVKKLARDNLRLVPSDTRQIEELASGIDDATLLVNLNSEYLDASVAAKQELLEISSLKARALRLLELMQTLKDSLLVQSEIREKLSSKLGKTQREHILREQLKAIRE